MALDPDSQDAVAYLEELLSSYGLQELSSWAYERVQAGDTPAMVRQQLWEQPAFKKRFKVIFDRRDRGLPAISVNEVLDYERKARQLFQAAGLPTGFYDTPDDFYQFLVNDVSLTELNSRVELARDYAFSVDATARAEVQRLYGLTDGQFTAYVLDRARALPLIQSQFLSAQNAAAARRSGYGLLSQTEAENLTKLGVDSDEAAQGFGALVASRQLFTPLPGQESAEDAITRQEQLAGAFGGDAQAKQKIARRGEARTAAFAGGGGFAADREGFSGLGSANT